MRTGPRPLVAHLGLALSAQKEKGQNSAALADSLGGMLDGIKKYQLHPFHRPEPPLECVWKAGTVRLFRYPQGGGATGDQHPLFLIPSMVNRAYILDLLDGQSFARMQAGRGRDVYLLDWGNSVDDPQQNNLDALFKHRLIPALRDGVRKRAHVLGYCMGGTLAVALAQLCRSHCASVSLLAAPWDFHAGGGDLTKWVQFWMPVGGAMMLQNGYLPGDWIQSVFASLDPFQTGEKFSAFAKVEPSDPKAQIFVAVEDWLNDPVHLPASLAHMCIQDWFINNKTVKGEWQVMSQNVRPQALDDFPCLVIASEKDRLIPCESSLAVMDHLCMVQSIRAQCGHIGFMASRRARDDIWPKITGFFDEVDEK